jgi:hypothetical protein
MEEGRVLKVLKTHHYKLPERTAALVAQASLDQVSCLLKETPGMRPDLWKLLLEQVGKGVSRRRKVEQNTDD